MRYLYRVIFRVMKWSVLLFLFLSSTVYSISTISIRSKVDTCLRTTNIGSTDANTTIKTIAECLVQARIFRVNYNFLHHKLYPIMARLEHSHSERLYLQNTIGTENTLWRQHLKTIQSQTVADYMRLQLHLEKNVPTLSKLSIKRTLDSAQWFVKSTNNTRSYISSLSTRYKATVHTLQNISSHYTQLQFFIRKEENNMLELNNQLENIKNEVLTLYDQ